VITDSDFFRIANTFFSLWRKIAKMTKTWLLLQFWKSNRKFCFLKNRVWHFEQGKNSCLCVLNHSRFGKVFFTLIFKKCFDQNLDRTVHSKLSWIVRFSLPTYALFIFFHFINVVKHYCNNCIHCRYVHTQLHVHTLQVRTYMYALSVQDLMNYLVSVRGRLTRWVCEKMVKKIAKSKFCQNECKVLT
jgi:hypothetical protein